MNRICFLLIAILVTSCTNFPGWKARLNNGTFKSQSGEFQVDSPIRTDYCLKVEENNTENSELVGFHECHGYIAETYVLTWYKVDTMNEEEFFEVTEKSFVPKFSKDIFKPIDEGEIVNSSRATVNGKPAVVFEVKTKTGSKPLMIKSSSI